MRILIIRHGDPYYPTDSLTEKGQREAELLSHKLVKEGVTKIYSSPHGRSRLTGVPTAEKLGLEIETLEWLREYPPMLTWEYETDFYKNMRSPWNMPPELWVGDPKNYDINCWKDADVLKDSKIVEKYEWVCEQFDAFLAENGFKRNGGLYEITEKGEGNTDTIALFCHGGLGASLVAHVLNMPLVAAWNSIFLPTSSVTTIFMERHIQDRPLAHGIFVGIGDTSHLFAGDEPISCSGLHTKTLK